MRLELLVVVVVEAFDGSLLDRAVHALDLTVGPRVLHLGQAVLDAVLVADAIQDVMEGLAVAGPVGELDAVLREIDHWIDF